MSVESTSGKVLPPELWPLRFESFAFGARCYNTLRCSIVFSKHEHAQLSGRDKPSGPPYAPNWKDDWSASFNMSRNLVRDGYPGPVEIKWTAMDGVERRVSIDLESIFPNREILHNAKQEDMERWWAEGGYFGKGHNVQILLEVNDQTINIYMNYAVRTKHLENAPGDPESHVILDDLMLAWTKTF